MRVPLLQWNDEAVVFEVRPNVSRLGKFLLVTGWVPLGLLLDAAISKSLATLVAGLVFLLLLSLPMAMWIVGVRARYRVTFDRQLRTVSLIDVRGLESAKEWSGDWSEIARLRDCPGGLQIEWQDGTLGPVLLLQQDAPGAFREIFDTDKGAQ